MQFPVGTFAVAEGAGNRVGIGQPGGERRHPPGEPDIILIGQKDQIAGRHGNRLFEVPVGAERNRVADVTDFRMRGEQRRNRLTGRVVRRIVGENDLIRRQALAQNGIQLCREELLAAECRQSH